MIEYVICKMAFKNMEENLNFSDNNFYIMEATLKNIITKKENELTQISNKVKGLIIEIVPSDNPYVEFLAITDTNLSEEELYSVKVKLAIILNDEFVILDNLNNEDITDEPVDSNEYENIEITKLFTADELEVMKLLMNSINYNLFIGITFTSGMINSPNECLLETFDLLKSKCLTNKFNSLNNNELSILMKFINGTNPFIRRGLIENMNISENNLDFFSNTLPAVGRKIQKHFSKDSKATVLERNINSFENHRILIQSKINELKECRDELLLELNDKNIEKIKDITKDIYYLEEKMK